MLGGCSGAGGGNWAPQQQQQQLPQQQLPFPGRPQQAVPVRQRNANGEEVTAPGDGHAGRAGRQVLLEALTGGLGGFSPSAFASADQADGADDSNQIRVRNTFIDVSACEGELSPAGSFLHHSGAQTCSARFSEPTPTSVFGRGLAPYIYEDEPYLSYTNNNGARTPSSSSSVCMDRVQQPFPVDPDRGQQAMPPPPAFAAPTVFGQDEPTSPPPAAAPGLVGRQVLLAAFCGGSVLPGQQVGQATPSTPAPPAGGGCGAPQIMLVQPMPSGQFQQQQGNQGQGQPNGQQQMAVQQMGVQQMASQQMAGGQQMAGSQQMALVAPGQLQAAVGQQLQQQQSGQQVMRQQQNQVGQTMVVMGPVLQFAGNAQQGGQVLALPVQMQQQQQGMAMATMGATGPALSVGGQAPSVGSQQHGKVLPDGQPACQPCAWFYKATGCTNGANCNRCHLCPEGELKVRKKQKLARLRNASKESSPKAMGSTLSGPLGEVVDGKSLVASPRWADIDPDDDDDDELDMPQQLRKPQPPTAVPIQQRGRSGPVLQVPGQAPASTSRPPGRWRP